MSIVELSIRSWYNCVEDYGVENKRVEHNGVEYNLVCTKP